MPFNTAKKTAIDIALEAGEEKNVVYDQVSDTGAGILEEDWELFGNGGFCVEPAFGFLAVPEAPTPW